MSNIPFAVDFRTMSRIEFTLALDALPTNVVEGLRPGGLVEIR